MVLVQYLFGQGQVVFDFSFFVPRQAYQRINIVAHHRSLGRHGRHELEFFQLAFGFFARLSGHAGGFDFLFNFFNVSAVFTFAQLFLNGLDLLVQIKIALVFFHLPLDAAANAFVHIQNVHFALELFKKVIQAVAQIRQAQHGLLVFEL